MSALARPAVLTALLTASAAALHPQLRAAAWLPGRQLLLPALLLLCAIGLAARARAASGAERAGAWLLAVGFGALVAGLGLDGVRGVHGTVRLDTGQATSTFDEQSDAGAPLGLRPFGITLAAERVSTDGAVVLRTSEPDTTVELRPGESVRLARWRLARPRVRPNGGLARLRVSMSDGARTDVIELVPGEVARVRDLSVSLGEYYPDFALDERQQPFTRSLEPRNPAALLDVDKGGARYRAFVLRSMPGVHRVEPLGLSFSLLDLEPTRSVEIDVQRQPFAPLVLGGGVVVVLGLAFGLRRGSAPQSASVSDAVLLAGALLVVALVVADGGRVLGWTFSVRGADARIPLAGVGLPLGLALLSALGGTLLRAAGGVSGVEAGRRFSRVVLWTAVAAAALGSALALVRVSVLPDTTHGELLQVAALLLPSALLATTLWWTRGGRRPADALAPVVALVVVVVSLGALLLAFSALRLDGSYATQPAAAAAAVVLLGLSALESTTLLALRRFVFLAAAITLLAYAA